MNAGRRVWSCHMCEVVRESPGVFRFLASICLIVVAAALVSVCFQGVAGCRCGVAGCRRVSHVITN